MASASPTSTSGPTWTQRRRAPQVQLGDTVMVKVTLTAPSDLNFLVLEDYLPAGLEPIDTSLKTDVRRDPAPPI